MQLSYQKQKNHLSLAQVVNYISFIKDISQPTQFDDIYLM